MLLNLFIMLMNNDKIKVKITIGNASVEIEAYPDQIEDAVRRVVSALNTQPAARQQEKRRGTTCRDILERLIDEGWFSQYRTLSEVTAELARRGYFYDSTAIAHGLLDLVREEKLVRDGSPRRYMYRESGKKNLLGAKEERAVKQEEEREEKLNYG